ncbi:MAG: ZIP family metal transporter [Bacilli bacterium]
MKYGLLLTLVAGLFFLIGIFMYKKSKHRVTLSIITSACAFVVILGLIIFDLLPELIELKKWWVFLFVFLGLGLLFVLDLFIPDHEHNHKDNDYETEEHEKHLSHIGLITIIALMLHNMVEGAALYSVTTNSLKSGILMCLGIGLHNIPLGFQIANYSVTKKNKILLFFLVISALLGGLIVLLFGTVNEIVFGIITAITLGMILHILLFELLKEVYNNRKRKENYYGIIIGIIVLILINII